MKVDNMNESISPLPDLEISAYTKTNFIGQHNMDRAMCIIYKRRPDFFLKSAERDKKWEQDKTQDEEAWMHDGFYEELYKFVREEVSKEIKIPTLSAMAMIVAHARAVARLMYG
jgi:hypothetical protein